MRKLWLILVILLANEPVTAQLFEDDLQDYQSELTAFWENDAFIINPDDRYYTNGARISYRLLSEDVYVFWKGKYRPIKFRDPETFMSMNSEPTNKFEILSVSPTEMYIQEKKAKAPKDPLYRFNYGFTVGQNMYTPSKIEWLPRQVNLYDRPYAGWLYFSFYKEKINSKNRYSKYECMIGNLGPSSFAEEAQKWVHRDLTDSQEPRGWELQIDREIVFLLNYERSFLYVPFQKEQKNKTSDSSQAACNCFDLQPGIQFNLGNIFTNAELNCTFRLGKVKNLFRGHGLQDAIPSVANGIFYVTKPYKKHQKWYSLSEFFLFCRLEGKFVIYNATIQGGMFNQTSPHTEEIRHGVIGGDIGAALYLHKVSLVYSHAFRSTEVLSREWNATQHNWGQFQLIFRL
ncbi:lipid A deacylase LpxR family protein [candidate division CSSED10-310 bacterium]|uniref:Lipid A deacylase LpxR family protein n=1 Tax=candidate division CSSED10-310 bacterium TaxID=2855610 RepID=A0ABV6Z338_UNCC1